MWFSKIFWIFCVVASIAMMPFLGKMSNAAARGSQTELVDHLVRKSMLKTPRVIKAMKAVDRKKYINLETAGNAAEAYQVQPCKLPLMLAVALRHAVISFI